MIELVQTALGSVFAPNVVSTDEKVHDELCALYLNDYIAAVYKPTDDPAKDDEHQVNLSSMNLFGMVYCVTTLYIHHAIKKHRWQKGWGRGGGGLGVLEHPQLSRSRYSDRAVTLIQQSAQNSYSLLIDQSSQNYGLKCPQIQSSGSIFQKFLGEHAPRPPK